jgi:YidC/Oxa1 family membrane protein insertase
MGRFLTIAALSMVLCVAAAAAPLPSQEGLPPELTIAPTPPLADQLQALQSLRAWNEANRPRGGGFLEGLGKMFSRSSSPQSVQAQWLVDTPDAFRGKPVELSGVYGKVSGETGTLNTAAGPIRLSIPPGVETRGFTGGLKDGAPISVEGLVESAGMIPQIRVSLIKPSDWLTLLRIARVQELMDQPEAALKTYDAAAMPASRTAFAGFARSRAGLIAYDQRDFKSARTHLSASWNSFAGNDRLGHPKAVTWVPLEDGTGWEKLPLTKAIAKPLDTINRSSFWYQFMEFFVNLAGGSRWLGILLLSVVSRVVIWPLTKKQLASAEAMKRLQPQIKALQDRYVDDKQKFQEEFWRLCQANGVNPLGGCLPMLIQMPVLIFLYRGIQQYIVQFDGHPFLWVKNLAAPDLPLLVLYTLSMILFQKMTQKLQPTPTMNAQQAQQQQMMTYMMPIMFFFFFQSFPAAFLLYWVATNVVYFAQQYGYTKSVARHQAAGETESLTPGGTPPKPSGGFAGAMTRMMSLKAEADKDQPAPIEQQSFHEKQAQSQGKKTSKPADRPAGKRPGRRS